MKQTARVKYPIGIQSFEKLREENYLYVDKTAFLYSIITNQGYYFLSRPRRFGKSLLLSTLEAYYQGRRDLFEGLALSTLTDNWDPHPVLHIDLNYGQYERPEDLVEILSDYLTVWEKRYNLPIASAQEVSASVRFNRIIKAAYESTGKKVVILVDEYDKPLLNAINNQELANIYRSYLKAFYSNLKTLDQYIELGMLTGVARFSKVSIFSDLNNLRDISFVNEYSAICGITAEELDLYFQTGINDLAEETGQKPHEVREELRNRYDGYHFSVKSPDIYNPFSLINVFANKDWGDYWFSSGTPTFLVRLIERGDYYFRDIAPYSIHKTALESAGLLDKNPIPAFYQSGYLTIKDYDRDYQTYSLDYPNEEVKRGFLDFLLQSYIPAVESWKGFSIPDFAKDMTEGKPEIFMKRMESLIASVPYGEKGSAESHFQNAVYLLFTLLGYYVRMEDRTSDGRIDLQLETSRYVYIFEFKIDSSAKKAMEQIFEKKYWLREAMGNKKIFLIGANFDTTTRRLNDLLIENAD
ncbi:MAG: ATP-binding protein [Muribaculaceae bacterium]|nr:ATP-binding protein [Muribaculaceae bacterium]